MFKNIGIISAKEARERFEQYCQSELDKEIETIEQKILYAVAQGKNYVTIESGISTSAEKMLKKLKYKVKDGLHYNGYFGEPYTYIEW